MRAYKVELLVIDFDEVGKEGIKEHIENVKYPNYCISPKVMNMVGEDIGEWSDDHPLNKKATEKAYYSEKFHKDEN